MQSPISWYTLALAAFFTFVLFSANQSSQKTLTAEASETGAMDLPQQIRAVPLADRAFDFAGESLPMDNFDVRERLDRELLRNSYYHSNTILLLKRAKRYFPTIEKILAEEEVPEDLKYLCVIESDLSNAVSPAGAKGFWQFMKGTAGDYGLEVNSEVDERFHLEKATRAACRYLKKYREKFGSWTLAAAAYNTGGNRLSKEIQVQRGQSYYDLNLNAETARYVFRIVAMKTILTNPQAFGFDIEEATKYAPFPDYHTIEVKESVANWGDFATKYGTTYRMLKVYNPWLRTASLSNRTKKTYEIRVPKRED
ncbi:MAG: lytic transglycosylase domain-containing protein [Bacteroidota bacterium]